MDVTSIIASIDSQIATLQQARAAITAIGESPRRRGRSKGSGKVVPAAAVTKPSSKKRHAMSPEGRARVAAAQRARGAAEKKTHTDGGSAATVKKPAKAPEKLPVKVVAVEGKRPAAKVASKK
jgi:hypothetical protein